MNKAIKVERVCQYCGRSSLSFDGGCRHCGLTPTIVNLVDISRKRRLNDTSKSRKTNDTNL